MNNVFSFNFICEFYAKKKKEKKRKENVSFIETILDNATSDVNGKMAVFKIS